MSRLLGVLVLAAIWTGCVSHTRQPHRAERPDPVVGDLRCAIRPMSVLEALYYVPVDHDATTCEPG